MNNEPGVSRAFPVFSIVFGIAYFFSWGANWALVTYLPEISLWLPRQFQ